MGKAHNWQPSAKRPAGSGAKEKGRTESEKPAAEPDDGGVGACDRAVDPAVETSTRQ